jgi:hypothetical protein
LAASKFRACQSMTLAIAEIPTDSIDSKRKRDLCQSMQAEVTGKLNRTASKPSWTVHWHWVPEPQPNRSSR